jgi:hypothetical protein
MSFYKRDGEELLVAPNSVEGPGGLSLSAATHANFIYPVAGWYWWDTLDIAMTNMRLTPTSVTMRQARLALLGAGLLVSVQQALNNMLEPTKTAALIEWEYSSVVERHGHMIMVLAPVLGLSEAQIDGLFAVATTL